MPLNGLYLISADMSVTLQESGESGDFELRESFFVPEMGFFENFRPGVFTINAERRNIKRVSFSDFDVSEDEDRDGGLEGCVKISMGFVNKGFGDVRKEGVRESPVTLPVV